MIRQIAMKITALDGQRLHSNWGYALYGILSNQANPDYIADLHRRNETPISQYLEVLPNGREAIWRINLLGAEAIDEIGQVFLQNDHFQALHHKTTIRILEKEWGPIIAERDFCTRYLIERGGQRKVTLDLLTPTSFKSQEAYQLFPSRELIIKSLWRNWQAFAKEVLLEGDEVREQMIQSVQISDYQLKSLRYPLKSNKIPGFKGQLTLTIKGPEPLVRLVNMLLAFGSYSGLGIKTALGMGGYRIKGWEL